MSEIVCVHHPDRLALAYCSGCGKALCNQCVVRLSTGNYCDVCAETPDHRPAARRAGRSRVWLWIGLAILILAGITITRFL